MYIDGFGQVVRIPDDSKATRDDSGCKQPIEKSRMRN